jgi:signal transduction histidine kinase
MRLIWFYLLAVFFLLHPPGKALEASASNSDTTLIEHGWEYWQQKKLSLASQVFEQALNHQELNSNDSAFAELGIAALTIEADAYLAAQKKLEQLASFSNKWSQKRKIYFYQLQILAAIHTHQFQAADKLLINHKKLFAQLHHQAKYAELQALLKLEENKPRVAMNHFQQASNYALQENDTLQWINLLNKEGGLLLRQNLADSSRKIFRKAYTLALKDAKYHAYAVHVLNNLGLTYTRTGAYEKARQLHRKALSLTDSTNFPEGLIASQLLLAHNYSSQNQYDSSLAVYHKALKIAEANKLINAKAHIYKNIALTHQKMGTHDRARYYYSEAQRLYERLNYQLPIAEITRLNGNLYLSEDRFVEALEAYIKSLHIYQEYQYDRGAAEIYLNLGLVFENIHNYEKALDYYEKGLAIQKKYADRENLAYATQLVGNNLLKMGKLQEAVEKYKESIRYREELGEPLSLASSFQSLGNANMEMANYDLAIKYHEKALNLRRKHKDISGQAYSYNSLGNIALKQDQTKLALQNYKHAMELANEVNNLFIYGLTSRKIGELHLTLNRTHLGLGYINNSLQTGKQINHAVMQEKALEDLYKFYKEQGRTKQAFKYYLEYDSIRDSLARLSSQQRITEIQKNYELEQKNRELTEVAEQVDLLQKTNKQQEILIKRKNQLQSLAFGAALLLLVIVILIYFQWKQKRKHNSLLTKQNARTEQINKELRASQEALRNTNATKDKFFSIIAHDLRNPFMALYGLTDQLIAQRNELSKKEMSEHLSLIKNAAEQLLDLLENLLYWSRSQRGKIIFTPSKLSLSKLLSQAINLQKLTAQNKEIQLHSQINCKSDVLVGDEDMLKTVLRNLLSNAIKFSHPGSEVRIEVFENSEEFLFHVIDQGIGMSGEKVENLFQLEQKSSTGTANEHGTGLGLLLCREFVDKHNGKIWAESVLNHGTIINFTIPKSK